MVTVFLEAVMHVAAVIAVSPLLLGIINRTKAIAAGRRGAPLLQCYFDLWRLFHKEIVLSRTTTWVFLFGPVATLTACAAASLLVPIGFHPSPVSFAGDIVLFGYLLALSRFFIVLAALDTGSSFEGMGAAREASFAAFAEPTVFMVFIALAKMTGSFSLSSMLLLRSEAHSWEVAVLVLISLAFFLALLAENSRIPFDDPNTHLELTMVHEVMVLDHSGPSLGLIVLGSAVKLFLSCTILVSIVVPKVLSQPLPESAPLTWLLYAGFMMLCAVLVGVVESNMARLRLPSIPKLLVGACLLSVFGVVLLMR